jgi:hypothetical protein
MLPIGSHLAKPYYARQITEYAQIGNLRPYDKHLRQSVVDRSGPLAMQKVDHRRPDTIEIDGCT